MKYKISNQTITNATIYMVVVDNGIIFRIEPDEGFFIAEKNAENPEKAVIVIIPESRKEEINNYIAVKMEENIDA